MKTLHVIVGPTAIGKTKLSIEMAKILKTEIISSDSRQFYKELNIGTAKPTKEEMQGVPHHFINTISIHHNYSVGQFEKEAIDAIDNLFEKYNDLIMVGGSGLYEKAVTQGLDFFPTITYKTKDFIQNLYKSEGLEALQKFIKMHDAKYYHQADIYNVQRLLRAAEVIQETQKPFSSFRTDKIKPRHFKITKYFLSAPREVVYQRINSRVDAMIINGLVEECKTLFPFKELNALQTVGYKEIFSFFKNEITLELAIEEIKKNTRRFAKRQITWYNKDTDLQRLEYNQTQSFLKSISQTYI